MTLKSSVNRSLRLGVCTALAAFAALPLAAHAQLDKATTEAVESYFEFIDYNSGTLMSEQIPAEDYKKLYVLDVRDAGQFAKEHIPGARKSVV